MDLIRADASPLTVDNFDAGFERARPRVLAVTGGGETDLIRFGLELDE